MVVVVVVVSWSDHSPLPYPLTLRWCELNYVELLSALPPYVSRFLADTVPQEWHYTLAEPRAHVKEEEVEVGSGVFNVTRRFCSQHHHLNSSPFA